MKLEPPHALDTPPILYYNRSFPIGSRGKLYLSTWGVMPVTGAVDTLVLLLFHANDLRVSATLPLETKAINCGVWGRAPGRYWFALA